MIECQVDHVMKLLQEKARRKAARVEVTREAQEGFVASVRAAMRKTVWGTASCGSWYSNARGEISALWPHNCTSYWKQTSTLDLSSYKFV